MSTERYFAATLEKSVEKEIAPQTLQVKDLFADLPLVDGADLEILSPMVPEGLQAEELREKINDRYLDLLNLRKRNGQYESLPVNRELAFALLDSQLFDQIKEEINKDGQVIKVARHEDGHAFVAARLGWTVTCETVEPGSDYLGLTIAIPPAGKSFEQLLLERAAISFGGAIAAQMSGDEVRGTGADMAHAQALARFATSLPNARYASEGDFLSDASNLAHNILKAIGPSKINDTALYLFHKKTIT